MNWRDDAACRGMDPALFFLERGANGDAAQAEAVCATCPVREECLDDALQRREPYGIWGGTTEKDRRRLCRELRRRSQSLGVSFCAVCGAAMERPFAMTPLCSDACRAERHRQQSAESRRRAG